MVFGATGGIGSALCKRLSKHEGAAVVMVGRDQTKLDALKAGLTACSTSTLVADVTDSKQVEEAIAQAAQQHGRIDAVANCVGSIVLKSAHTTTDAEFDQAGSVAGWGLHRTTQSPKSLHQSPLLICPLLILLFLLSCHAMHDPDNAEMPCCYLRSIRSSSSTSTRASTSSAPPLSG